ncbi:MAG: hypothetical protein WBM92_02875, partial [Aureibaculum sp.]
MIFPTYAGKSLVPVKEYNHTERLISSNSFTSYSSILYNKLNDNALSFEAFKFGLKGYLKLQNEHQLKNSKYLTIVDMS